MPLIKILPHEQLCPNGKQVNAQPGEQLCKVLLNNHVEIEHACEMSCACTTCHVIIHEGFNSLKPSSDSEDDLLDMAWGLTAHSRLSCQVQVANQDLTIELPKYTKNHAREHH